MDNNQEQKNPLSSMVPVLIAGVVGMMVMQYFFTDPPKPPEKTPGGGIVAPGQSVEKGKSEKGSAKAGGSSSDKKVDGKNPARRDKNRIAKKDQNESGLADFKFKAAKPADMTGKRDETQIDSEAFLAIFSRVGGRVKKFYLKSHGALRLPDAVVANSDTLGKANKALEVTYRNGMDFQPHLYWWKNVPGGYRIIQIANPPLNNALFSKPEVRKRDGNIQEIIFRLPVTIKGHKLELIKFYRFIKGEHFFRQITVLRNKEKKSFQLGGNGEIFFKTYGDIGTEGTVESMRSSASRFYYYNGALESVGLGPDAGGGCNMFCGSNASNNPFDEFNKNPNTFHFLGSSSRYMFSYSRFHGPKNNPLHTPDGLIMINREDITRRQTATTIFQNISFDPASNKFDEDLLFSGMKNNPGLVKGFQEQITEALIIDSVVYFGVRSDEAHSYFKPEIMKNELGVPYPDGEARNALFSYGYFSFFSSIKDGIVWLMRWIYQYTGNYGWAIIIIAVSFKLITFPLNQMQAKSMKRMQAIKPEVDKINEKYKDKEQAQEKQKAIMALYKKHNVNPAKGCLPMLIQMPVFIALFSAFSESVELWRSPFIFWMTDLSAPDTIAYLFGYSINILPLLMAGSQILTTMQTTVTADKQQQMMMYIMPVVFTFIFWSMPSGVTLYWTVQNMLTVGWQIASNKLSKDDEPVS